jgi:hypothetical protein
MFFRLTFRSCRTPRPPILPGAWCPPALLVRLAIPTERLAERPWRNRQFLRVLEGKVLRRRSRARGFAPSPSSGEVSLARARGGHWASLAETPAWVPKCHPHVDLQPPGLCRNERRGRCLAVSRARSHRLSAERDQLVIVLGSPFRLVLVVFCWAAFGVDHLCA